MRTMTAADLCKACLLHGHWLVEESDKRIPCPNCHHQTPAERVVEAALEWRDSDDSVEAVIALAAAVRALADLDR